MRVPACQTFIMEDRIEALQLNSVETAQELMLFCLKKCQLELLSGPLITRPFISQTSNPGDASSENCISVMQWNVLSQAIGFHFERFSTCSKSELLWSSRKWKIIFEIAQYQPDVVCLQEMDRFHFVHKILQKIGYDGLFVPKPDSPCYHLPGNTGPDGCAIFFKTQKLALERSASRVLQVCGCRTNQVVLACHLRIIATGKTFCVATTHLKARKGPLLAELRDEQGKDLLDFLSRECKDSQPLILTGDFNAESHEPVYSTMTRQLSSVYCEAYPDQSEFNSNWTHRHDEEETKQTIDYVFYTRENLKCVSLLDLASDDLLSPMPNNQYPSDHLSLVARFLVD